MWRFLIGGLCAVLALGAWADEQLLTVRGRGDTTQRVLLTHDPARPPDWVALLLPGGLGDYEFQEQDGRVVMKNEARLPNRLRPLLLAQGVASLMVDAPSDRPRLDDTFRTSPDHMHDLSAVLKVAGERWPGVPVVVIGHSNGSISAAHLAATAPDRVSGGVLVAARLTWNRFSNAYIAQEGLSRFDWARIGQPLLLLHHHQDACPFTPYRGAAELADRVKRFELATIGAPDAAAKGACDYLGTHNLTGDEAAVTEQLVRWGARFKR